MSGVTSGKESEQSSLSHKYKCQGHCSTQLLKAAGIAQKEPIVLPKQCLQPFQTNTFKVQDLSG